MNTVLKVLVLVFLVSLSLNSFSSDGEVIKGSDAWYGLKSVIGTHDKKYYFLGVEDGDGIYGDTQPFIVAEKVLYSIMTIFSEPKMRKGASVYMVIDSYGLFCDEGKLAILSTEFFGDKANFIDVQRYPLEKASFPSNSKAAYAAAAYCDGYAMPNDINQPKQKRKQVNHASKNKPAESVLRADPVEDKPIEKAPIKVTEYISGDSGIEAVNYYTIDCVNKKSISRTTEHFSNGVSSKKETVKFGANGYDGDVDLRRQMDSACGG